MKRNVMITGASAGIGREMASIYAQRGDDLVLVARRRDALDELAQSLSREHGVRAQVVAADLAAAGAADAVVAAVEASGVEVDILVNNAGFGARGTVAELPLQRQLEMVTVNVTALTHLTRLLLPGMVRRGRGGVLNVASTAAFQPGPWMAVYYATKAYVLSFTEGLAEELVGTGVGACCLAPGATRTEFAQTADMEDSLLFRMGAMDAATVARAGVEGLANGRLLVVPGLLNKIGAASVRFTPRWVVRKMVRRLQA